MPEEHGLLEFFYRYKKALLISLIFFLLAVPVFDSLIIQRDRNRNMAYGQIFWQEGLKVYDLNDRDLFEKYGVPEDHLLTGVLNVTYEYPVITLFFYAALAALDPGTYEPTHFIVNWVLAIFAHMNFVMFAYLGQSYLTNRWFKRLGMLYYCYAFAFSVIFPKEEPFVDFLFMSSLVLFQKGMYWRSYGVLGVAFQTKIYPAMAFPLLLPNAPLASLAFFGTALMLSIPLLLTGMGYESLLAHLFNYSGYAEIITNPFYAGWVFENPLAIIAPLLLVYSFLLAAFETSNIGPMPYPRPHLRTRDWRAIYVYALPLLLILFSWTQIWYYSWFVIPALLLRSSNDMENFRWIMVGVWIAHFAGILLNLEYFIEGPFIEFFNHLEG